MPRYQIDPMTGTKTKVSGTEYIPPCLVKTEAKKAILVDAPDTETVKDETAHKDID